MNILIIDNNIRHEYWGSADLVRLCSEVAQAATVFVRRAPQQDLPHSIDGYDRVIISGSLTSIEEDATWIDELQVFIKKLIAAKKPILGVCYGHQILIRTLGGKKLVGKAPSPEIGWSEIHTLKETPLFKGLPKKFYSFSSHFDQVHALPPEAECFAKSSLCAIQAYQVKGTAVFGIQFHPERDYPAGQGTLKEMAKNKKISLLNAKKGKSVYNPEVGKVIFKNFLNYNCST